MLTVTGVTRAHGAQVVLANVDLVVPPDARIGLVGPNGVGKSTLLRLLAGVDVPDAGSVGRSPGLAVGLLPQERDPARGETLHGYLARRTGVAPAERRMDELAARLADEPLLVQPYHDALEEFLARDGEDLDARAQQALTEVGLAVPLDRPLGTLSGG